MNPLPNHLPNSDSALPSLSMINCKKFSTFLPYNLLASEGIVAASAELPTIATPFMNNGFIIFRKRGIAPGCRGNINDHRTFSHILDHFFSDTVSVLFYRGFVQW